MEMGQLYIICDCPESAHKTEERRSWKLSLPIVFILDFWKYDTI
jgi:hypothetical protein